MSQQLYEPSTLLTILINKVESGDIEGGKDALAQMKIAMLSFDPSNPAQKAMAITALEYGALLAVADDGDMEAFARNVAQLKSYYYAHENEDNKGDDKFQRKCHILGLNLMHLLVDNRLSEFHAELERSEAVQNHPFVAFPIRLERQLMVGSYDEVLLAVTSTVPSPYFSLFLSSLAQTVRDNIADCLEVAYSNMSLEAAAKMMRLSSVDELKDYIAISREDWIIEAIPGQKQQLCFRPPPAGSKASDVPSLKLITQCLSYATELERIV